MDRIKGPLHKPERLLLEGELWEKMQADVEGRLPQEACGLIAGLGDRAMEVIPITNQLHSSTRYRLDPQEQIEAFKTIQDKGLELTGIYHSHPKGPQAPSPTDIAEAFYPESIYLIWSLSGQEWICRGFVIQQGRTTEIPLLSPDQ
jgi:proteasome lid subunit RPN8/RPN11